MNYFKSTKKLLLLASVLSVTALFPIAANALCCGIDKVAKGVTNTVSSGVSSGVNAVSGGVNAGIQGAQETAAKAQGFKDASEAAARGYADNAVMSTYSAYSKTAGYANLAAADVAAKALGYVSYIDRLTKTSLPFAPGEYVRLSANLQQPWSNLIIQTRQMYGVGQGAALSASRMLLRQPGINIMSELAQQCAGNVIGTAQTIRTIAPQVAAMANLQPEVVNALTRIVRTLLQRGGIDEQLAADMKMVGTAIGYFQQSFPANFSIAVTGSVGSDNMGGSIAVAYAMDTFPTDGKYRSALTISGGPSVSLIKTEPISMAFVLGLSQGSSVDAEGASYGIGMTVGSYNGGLSWDLPPSFEETVVKTSIDLTKNLTDPTQIKRILLDRFQKTIDTICAQPSVSGGVNLPWQEPKELDLSFSAGYSHVLRKFAF